MRHTPNDMTTIALDSSTDVCSAALLQDGKVIAERCNLTGSNHAALLPAYVQELLASLSTSASSCSNEAKPALDPLMCKSCRQASALPSLRLVTKQNLLWTPSFFPKVPAPTQDCASPPHSPKGCATGWKYRCSLYPLSPSLRTQPSILNQSPLLRRGRGMSLNTQR